MTEIQWIIHLMMNHQLPDEVKKICLERIGEVETKINSNRQFIGNSSNNPQPYPGMVPAHIGPSSIGIGPTMGPPISAAQAKFQAEMSQQQIDQLVTQPLAVAAPHVQPIKQYQAPAEVVTSTTSFGSTRGPNKLRRPG